jgi:hypothetical protein
LTEFEDDAALVGFEDALGGGGRDLKMRAFTLIQKEAA